MECHKDYTLVGPGIQGTIVESARSIPYGGINLLEIMYSLPTMSP
jgi:hypothetical protein